MANEVMLDIEIDERGCSALIYLRQGELKCALHGAFIALSHGNAKDDKWEFETSEGGGEDMDNLCKRIVKDLDVTTRGTLSGEAIFWASEWLGCKI